MFCELLMDLTAAPDAELPLCAPIRRLTSTPNLSWLSTRMEQAGMVSKTKDADDAPWSSL